MISALPAHAREILEEEISLLRRVQGALAEATKKAGERPSGEWWGQLRELRDEALSASERDLPSLFQQMVSVRALAENTGPRPLPDAANPFFAHLKLRDKRGVRDFLLGRATHIDTGSGVRVIDWRFAPVAKIFYKYRTGDEYEEEFPGGVSEGTVEARRIVVVENGELVRVIDGRTVLTKESSGEWRLQGGEGGLLGGGQGTALRPDTLGVGADVSRKKGRTDITSLLDGEQFEAINADGSEPLLVLGSAGSGKTTVALHRLAKLVFDHPQRYPEQRLRVVVPESGLARLSRRLLGPLGLGGVAVETLSTWLEREALEAFGAGLFTVRDDTPPLATRLKRHPALRDALVERIGDLKSKRGTYTRLRARLAEALTDRTLLESVVAKAGGVLPLTAIDETVKHTLLQVDAPSNAPRLADDDGNRITSVDGRDIDEGTNRALAGTVDFEDLALLLFLRGRAGESVETGLAHLVVDEAEDLSLFEAEVLGSRLGKSRSCTLAGDEMQQTDTSFPGWPALLDGLGAKRFATCRLQVSYRCPRPIAEFARQVLGGQAPEAGEFARDGVPVGRHSFPDEAQSQLFLADALRDLLDREPEASIGVVAHSDDAAKAIYDALENVPLTRLVLDGEFTFEPGIDVTDVDNAKGLEWDYVIVPDANAAAYPINDEARRRLHVAVTRASHQLWVVSSGRPSALLPKEG